MLSLRRNILFGLRSRSARCLRRVLGTIHHDCGSESGTDTSCTLLTMKCRSQHNVVELLDFEAQETEDDRSSGMFDSNITGFL